MSADGLLPARNHGHTVLTVFGVGAFFLGMPQPFLFDELMRSTKAKPLGGKDAIPLSRHRVGNALKRDGTKFPAFFRWWQMVELVGMFFRRMDFGVDREAFFLRFALVDDALGLDDLGGLERRQILEPQARRLFLGVPELPRMDELVGRADMGRGDADGVFKADHGDRGVE